jgi:uncharacterized membrane protein
MPLYETSVEIEAPAARVYAVTADLETWPDWSPTMDAVTRQDTGPLRPGSTARVRQPRLRPATWVVDEATPDRTFVWHTSGAGYRIVAEHDIAGEGATSTVRLAASMSGPLAPVIWALAGRTVRRYLDEEAAALKRRCETA